MEKRKTISIRIDEKLWKQFKRKVKKDDETVSSVVRKLIKFYTRG